MEMKSFDGIDDIGLSILKLLIEKIGSIFFE